MKRITIIFSSDADPVLPVTELLGQYQINIEAFDFNKFGANAYLSLSVSDYDRALSVLIEKGYQAISNDIVLIHSKNHIGELAEISRTLMSKGVGIRSLSLIDVHKGEGIIAMVTTDNEMARTIFAEVLAN